MSDAMWLTLTTFLLIAITGWYAYETRRIVKRMDRELEEVHRPILRLLMVPWDGVNVKLRIQNVGNGAATNIKGTIESILNTNGASISWSYTVLASGKYEEFGFPMPADVSTQDRFSFKSIRSTVIEVKSKFTYKSVSGKSYTSEDCIPIREITDDWFTSRMLVTEDHPDRLGSRIAKALEELAKNVSRK